MKNEQFAGFSKGYILFSTLQKNSENHQMKTRGMFPSFAISFFTPQQFFITMYLHLFKNNFHTHTY